MTATDRAQRSRLRAALDAVSALSITVACAVFVWAVLAHRPTSGRPEAAPAPSRRAAPKPLPSAPLDIKGAASMGTAGAKLAVIQYSDFQCPFCVSFATQTLPAIVKEFVTSGRVQLIFRHLPLEARHPFALKAAEAAECSRLQGKFWEMHDALFAMSGELSPKALMGTVRETGLDAGEFSECMKGRTTQIVRGHISEARAFGITGTPTFLFGRIQPDGTMKAVRRESGAMSVDAFSQILTELLSASQATN